MKILKLAVLFLSATLCMSAFAAEGRWTGGFGQGNFEYFIDKDGYRLYVGCPTAEGSKDDSSSVSLSKISSGKDINKFTIKVNGQSLDGPFETNSRLTTDWFVFFMEALHKNEATVYFGDKTIRFPKSNAGKVIPSTNKMHCNLN